MHNGLSICTISVLLTKVLKSLVEGGRKQALQDYWMEALNFHMKTSFKLFTLRKSLYDHLLMFNNTSILAADHLISN